MPSLAKIEEKCKGYGLNPNSCIPYIRRILKVYKKDLRCTPLVEKLLKAFEGKPEESILKALEIYEKKAKTETETIHLNYFIAVLKSQSSKDLSELEMKPINWGKTV